MMNDGEQFEQQLRQSLAHWAGLANRGVSPEQVLVRLKRRSVRRKATGIALASIVVVLLVAILWPGGQHRGDGAAPILVQQHPQQLPDAISPNVTQADMQKALRDYLRSVGDIHTAIIDKQGGGDMSIALAGQTNKPVKDIRAGLGALFREFDEVNVQMGDSDFVCSLVIR
jgi:hypothetical protein